MDVHHVPELLDYGSKQPLLGEPGKTEGMGKNRFKSILQNLCLNLKMLIIIVRYQSRMRKAMISSTKLDPY